MYMCNYISLPAVAHATTVSPDVSLSPMNKMGKPIEI
jgi:hypothetical protein